MVVDTFTTPLSAVMLPVALLIGFEVTRSSVPPALALNVPVLVTEPEPPIWSALVVELPLIVPALSRLRFGETVAFTPTEPEP